MHAFIPKLETSQQDKPATFKIQDQRDLSQHTVDNQGIQYLRKNGMQRSMGSFGSVADQPSNRSNISIHQLAEIGVSGLGKPLPFSTQINAAFGHHKISATAHADTTAATAASEIGAAAYTKGNDIAFAVQPTLRIAAHEAAHVVQQRSGVQLSGNIGSKGDVYERHADAVADRVVSGLSCEDLLDSYVYNPNCGITSPPAVQCLEQSLPYVGPLLSWLGGGSLVSLLLQPLSASQKSLLDGIFGYSLATSVIRLNPNSVLASGNCFRTTGNIINMPGTTISDNMLIHEAAHVWQSQNSIFGVEYAVSALSRMAIAEVLGGDWQRAYDYSGMVRYRIPWRYWNAEQQASWIEHNRRLPSGWMLQAALPF